MGKTNAESISKSWLRPETQEEINHVSRWLSGCISARLPPLPALCGCRLLGSSFVWKWLVSSNWCHALLKGKNKEYFYPVPHTLKVFCTSQDFYPTFLGAIFRHSSPYAPAAIPWPSCCVIRGSNTLAARVKRSPLSPTLMFSTSFSTRIWRMGFPRQLSFFVEFLDGISEGFLKWIFMDEVFTRKTALGLAMKFMNQSSRPKLNRPGAFKAGESLVNPKMGSRLCPQIFSEVGFQLEQLRIKLVIKKA